MVEIGVPDPSRTPSIVQQILGRPPRTGREEKIWRVCIVAFIIIQATELIGSIIISLL
jgi:hypothetical protein